MSRHHLLGRFLHQSPVLIVAVLALYLASCGNGWKKCYPARGKILLDDKPIEGAEVWLMPTAEELVNTNPPVRPYGKTNKDGTFLLTTYTARDGAPAGTYKARVICEKKVKAARPGIGGEDDAGGLQNILSPKYADPEAAGLSVVIQPA